MVRSATMWSDAPEAWLTSVPSTVRAPIGAMVKLYERSTTRGARSNRPGAGDKRQRAQRPLLAYTDSSRCSRQRVRASTYVRHRKRGARRDHTDGSPGSRIGAPP